ncbi:hypothetical protein [Kribbella catacumbae]|uniref:hypothetical protein n=1 Tax=Kribbella catacumbae TaxID=460086 RepID=UPI000365AC06|nr:hypothetical protein [Kribbella catacumbae]
MEALSAIVNSKLVADEVRHSVGGYDEVRRIAAEAQRVQRRKPRAKRLWSALRQSVTVLRERRSSTGKEVVECPAP